jgi:ATP-dependent nuclease, subunit B
MKKKIDRIIQYILKNTNQEQELFFVSKDTIVIEYIKNKYNLKFRSKTKFFTIKKFIENISGLKIYDYHSSLLYFFSILKKDDFIEKKFHNFFNWGPKILNDFQNIDLNLVDIEYFFSSIISTEKINKWNLNFLEKEKFIFWEKIHKYYYILQSQLFKKERAYHGMLFKTAISRLDSFLYKNFNTKIVLFLVDCMTLNECEKIFIKKIIQQGLVYDLCEKNVSFSALQSLNKKRILNSKTYLQCDHFKIINVSKEVEQVKIVNDIICQLIKKYQTPEKILLIPANNNLTIPLVDSIKKLGINISCNINYSLNHIPIYYTFYSIFQLLLKKDKLQKFTKRDVIKVLSNGYIQKFFLKRNFILKKLSAENNTDFICENVIKRHLHKNDLWIIFKIPTHDGKKILRSIIVFIRKLKQLLFIKMKKHFLELKFIFKLEIYIQKLIIIVRKNKNFFLGINDIFNMYEEFTHTENIRYIRKNRKGLYITGFMDTFIENYDNVIITSFNEGVIPPNQNNLNSFIPFSICKKLQIHNSNESFYFDHLTRIIQFSKQTYLIYKDQPDEINSGEKSRFIYRIEKNSKISTEKINGSFFPIHTKRLPIIIHKTKSIIQCLHELIHKGLSPSSIYLYNYNPIIFYYKKILQLNEPKETSYKTKIGKIIHQILKILYDPIKNNSITIDCIHKMKKNYESIIKKILLEKEEVLEGNNMFFYYIIKNYINNFILWDEKLIQNGHKIIIKEIERKISAILNIGAKKVNLHGIIDRIDEYDGNTRILDYKIGFSKVQEINISSKNIHKIFYDTNYANTMQLLIYVYLWFESYLFKECQKKAPIIGIVSPKMNGDVFQIPVNILSLQNKKTNITYANYKKIILPHLVQRISDILDPKIPIIEKIY